MTLLKPGSGFFNEEAAGGQRRTVADRQTSSRGAKMGGSLKNNNNNSQDPLGCEEGPGVCAMALTVFSLVLIIFTLPLSLMFVVKVVQEYERAVIFRLGRLLTGGARGPGVFFIIPCVDTYEKIDMRSQTFEIPPQEILTKDSVTVFVNAIMYYKVANATHAVSNVDDYSGSARLLAATTLRNVLGTMTLGDILCNREAIAKEMKSVLDEGTEPWGVMVERVEVKDVRVPEQLQRAMAAEAEAARNARAKVIAAEGEHKASRSLRQAAEVIMDSPAALQLRYLQTLNSISAENNSTVIFPVPIDIMSHFMTSNNRAPDTNTYPTPLPPQPANIHMKPLQPTKRPELKAQESLQQLIGIIDDVKVPLEDLDDVDIEGESPDLELDIPELEIPELEVPDIDFKLDEVDLLPPDIDFPADIDMKKV